MMNDDADGAVHILFFSVLREKLGFRSVEMALDGPTAADALLDDLIATYPVLDVYRRSLRVAVNRSYVELDHVVHAGDEVALITPVSGG